MDVVIPNVIILLRCRKIKEIVEVKKLFTVKKLEYCDIISRVIDTHKYDCLNKDSCKFYNSKECSGKFKRIKSDYRRIKNEKLDNK